MTNNLLVSDKLGKQTNIRYIKRQIEETTNKLGGQVYLNNDGEGLIVEIGEAQKKYLRPLIEDMVADVIAINYKYKYFKKNIRCQGLNEVEYELLLSALISADIDDDKRYIRTKIKQDSVFSIDGSFNFRMSQLIDKWREIVSLIPTVFFRKELNDFIAYIIKEKVGRRVYVDGEKVYDGHFNRLYRSTLTCDDDEAKIVREIILSASGEVELTKKLSERDEFYLKEFFGDKIFFRKSYFC